MPTGQNLRTRLGTALVDLFLPGARVETPETLAIQDRLDKVIKGASLTLVPPPYRAPDTNRVRGEIVGTEVSVQPREFGPNKPIPAPKLSAEQIYGPRNPYSPGWNLQRNPRGEKSKLPLEPYDSLINLATEFPVVSVCIGARMEEMSSQPWSIVPADSEDESPQTADLCKELTEFWESPDKDQPFEGWISEAVGEQLTLDANAIFPRLTRGKKLYSLEHIAAETIKVVIDGAGREAGYQQYLYGRSMGDYKKLDARGFPVSSKLLDDTFEQNELLYYKRWSRPRTVYGFPPTEWITSYIKTAIAKIDWDEKYFTDGNIPELFMMMPDMSADPTAVHNFEMQFNADLEGYNAARRKVHMLPWNGNFYQPKPFSYDNALDKWIFFIVCAAFGMPPSELGYVEDVNRANGEVQERVNRRRGLDPMKAWWEARINMIIWRYWHTKKVKFQFNPIIDPPTMVDVEKGLLNGMLSRDEARKIAYPLLKGPAPKIENVMAYQIQIQKNKVVAEIAAGLPPTPDSAPEKEEGGDLDVTN